MTIYLRKYLENSIRKEVLSGHFASEEHFVTEAVREYLRQLRVELPQKRREETWRVIPGE
jgi:Arc/MetJ-type ribon-helix-helix transcriptional regulator